MITAPQRRALEVLRDRADEDASRLGYDHGVTGRELARNLWPDSPAWDRRTRFHATSNQGAVGGTMPMLGAKMGRRLEDLGFARVRYSSVMQPYFIITAAGRRELES